MTLITTNSFTTDVVAEWLTLWIVISYPAGSAGSNPVGVIFLYINKLITQEKK